MKSLPLIGCMLILSTHVALADQRCAGVNHQVPREARQGTGTGDEDLYWCRHSRADKYICTTYNSGGATLSEGPYQLYNISNGQVAGDEEKAHFDLDNPAYDSGTVNEIFLNVISPELSFRADGEITSCQPDGNALTLKFSEGQLIGIRFADDMPMITLSQP